METNLLKEVLHCLDDGRRLIHYHKDQYALFLLSSTLSDKNEVDISNIKEGIFAKLLQKQVVKQLMAGCGDGVITKRKIENFYVEQYDSFVVTLSEWGSKENYSWAQLSRPGKNLVIQLNFTGEHEQLLRRHKIDSDVFKMTSHPIHKTKSSIAWARIDFDFNTGEALIEEIQNDWLREVSVHLKLAVNYSKKGNQNYYYYGKQYNADNMIAYAQDTLSRYLKNWSETMLFTTVKFIKEELGINKIFYHTVETAKVLKNLNYSFPPVSLYTDLPKKFCFSKIENGPDFIIREHLVKRRVKKIAKAQWFYLEI